MADDLQTDLSSRDRRAKHLRLSRTFTGGMGYATAGVAVLGLIVSSLTGVIVSNAGIEAALLAMNAVSAVMLVASGAVVAGLLLQWLWLRAPGQSGSVPLLIGLLLMWGWGRLQDVVDLWGFASYPGSLEWSNPDIQGRLVAATVVSLLVWLVELVLLILGGYRMLRANKSPSDPLQADPASGSEPAESGPDDGSSEADDDAVNDKQH
ncbi:MAG: hypothetical protein K4304_02140 [Propionicimonas sp.]